MLMSFVWEIIAHFQSGLDFWVIQVKKLLWMVDSNWIYGKQEYSTSVMDGVDVFGLEEIVMAMDIVLVEIVVSYSEKLEYFFNEYNKNF